MKIHARTIALVLSLCSVAAAYAQAKASELELLLLPDYCRARLGDDPAQRAAWNKRIGNDRFIHLHHYCSGLVLMRRVPTASEKQRKNILEDAVKEFDYVIARWPADFALTVDAQNQRRQALIQLGRH